MAILGNWWEYPNLQDAVRVSSFGGQRIPPVTFAELPSPVTAGAGARGFMTDFDMATSAVGDAITNGGGSKCMPIYSDGTNWLVG